MGTVLAPGETDARVDMEKNEVQVSQVLKYFPKVPVTSILHDPDFAPCTAFHLQQKEPTLVPGMHRSKSKHELKLLEKIPENAEATVVLVGELSPTKALKTTHI